MWGLLLFLFIAPVRSQECSSVIIDSTGEFAMLLKGIAYQQSFNANQVQIKKFCGDSFKWIADAKTAERQKGLLVKENDRTREVDQYYLGCRSDTPWMNQLRDALCAKDKVKQNPQYSEIQHVKLPKNFLFLFDGMRDFNPSLGKSFGAVNLDGSEPNELNSGNAYGLKGFMSGFGEALPNFELHYHVSSGFYEYQNIDSALACAKQMNRYLDVLKVVDSREEPKWVTLGYSNGADRALFFQNRMANIGRPMDLVVTVDPIPQALFFPFNGLTPTIGKKHPATKKLVNLFQTDDHGSAGPLWLRGKPVDQADANIQVSSQSDEKMTSDGRRNHVNIASSLTVKATVACELKKLESPDAKCE